MVVVPVVAAVIVGVLGRVYPVTGVVDVALKVDVMFVQITLILYELFEGKLITLALKVLPDVFDGVPLIEPALVPVVVYANEVALVDADVNPSVRVVSVTLDAVKVVGAIGFVYAEVLVKLVATLLPLYNVIAYVYCVLFVNPVLYTLPAIFACGEVELV